MASFIGEGDRWWHRQRLRWQHCPMAASVAPADPADWRRAAPWLPQRRPGRWRLALLLVLLVLAWHAWLADRLLPALPPLGPSVGVCRSTCRPTCRAATAWPGATAQSAERPTAAAGRAGAACIVCTACPAEPGAADGSAACRPASTRAVRAVDVVFVFVGGPPSCHAGCMARHAAHGRPVCRAGCRPSARGGSRCRCQRRWRAAAGLPHPAAASGAAALCLAPERPGRRGAAGLAARRAALPAQPGRARMQAVRRCCTRPATARSTPMAWPRTGTRTAGAAAGCRRPTSGVTSAASGFPARRSNIRPGPGRKTA